MRNGTTHSQRSLPTSPDLGSGLHRQRLTSSLRVANSRLGPRETIRAVVTDLAVPRTRWGRSVMAVGGNVDRSHPCALHYPSVPRRDLQPSPSRA
ncbi:hypothetical protein GCM10009826_21440 [Humibacillus xanthopallidus]